MQQYNDFNKGLIQKWRLYLWILKILKHLILTDYYSILEIKWTWEKKSSILLYQILVFTMHEKILKFPIRIINLVWRIWITWWIIFCIKYSRLFKIYLKKHETVTDNPSIRTYINKIENRITFKIKAGYYLEFLTPETMKLFESAKSKITKDENGENVPRLKINEVA